MQSRHSRASLSCDQGHGCPIRCSCRLAPFSAHAEPGRTREECCPGITAPERNRTGVNRPALPFTLTGVWRHATDRNSSSPSTSVGIHLHSIAARRCASAPPARSLRGRPACRCCTARRVPSVNRTPHETRDHPTAASCRAAERRGPLAARTWCGACCPSFAHTPRPRRATYCEYLPLWF